MTYCVELMESCECSDEQSVAAATLHPSWYLIYCKPREDERALEHLRRQDYECYLPTMTVERRRQGRKTKVREPLFPRYLFIHLNDTEDNWYPIRSTRGVSQFVCVNGRPIPVRNEIVEGIRARLDAQPVTKHYLEPGELVKISDGAFHGIDAIFLAADGDERVVVLLNIMHKDHKLVLPLHAVRKLT